MLLYITTSMRKVKNEYFFKRTPLRLKKIRRKQFHFQRFCRFTLFAVLMPSSIAMLLFVGYTLLHHSEFFIVQHVNILGNHFIDRQTIIAAADIKYIESIFRIDLERMRQKIRTNPYVFDILVRRELPATIAIELQERNPIAIITINKKYFLISEDGVLVEEMSKADSINYPIIVESESKTKKVGDALQNKTFQEALLILTKMKEETPVCFSQLLTIQVHNSFNVSLKMRNLSGTIMIAAENISNSLVRLQYLMPQLTRTSFKSVDFRFRNKAIVKFYS
ncbi:cell division protein FtsQ/DivIB [candidate division CSSED10-310 bacterium]|uniref:Cell division protein FtsQ/DivIB n=1 Tax=candidate division CSSED10-310 bacterium TaxID=2855610 RepID=A0ABV6YV18_UNCC1